MLTVINSMLEMGALANVFYVFFNIVSLKY